MRPTFRALVAVFAVTTLVSACGGGSTTYRPAYDASPLNDVPRYAQVDTDEGHAQLVQAMRDIEAVPDDIKKKTIFYAAEVATRSDQAYIGGTLSYPQPREEIGVMIQFAVIEGSLVYRIGVLGDRSATRAFGRRIDLPQLVATLMKNGNPYFLPAEMPAEDDFDDGFAITEWTLCRDCLSSYATRDRNLQRYALEAEKLAKLPFTWPDLRSLKETESPKNLISGGDRAVAAAQQDGILLARVANGRAESAEANDAFTRYYEKTVIPATLRAHIRAEGCTTGMSPYPAIEFKGYWEDFVDEMNDYLDCRERAVRSYDFAAYNRDYPKLHTTAERLFGETFGIQKRTVPTPERQAKAIDRQLTQASKRLDEGYRVLDKIAENASHKRRMAALRQQMFAQVQTDFANDLRQIENNRPIATSDGRVTTVGTRAASAASSSGGRASGRALTLTREPAKDRVDVRKQEPLVPVFGRGTNCVRLPGGSIGCDEGFVGSEDYVDTWAPKRSTPATVGVVPR
ncbi:MAG: hypothetical protein AAF899_04695 [Pseudomonadota bacterium]